jgi:competence protein ComEC
MPSRRAPLFSVSLALAAGCLVALDGWISLRAALAALLLVGLVWWVLRRREQSSLAAFYALVACSGSAHTLLMASAIAPEDLRRLPDDKTLATTQWRGFVVEEPVAQLSVHTAHHALDRTSFVFRVDGWRPTGGRFFNAPIDAPWLPAQGDVRCTLVGPAREMLCGDRLEMAMAIEPVPAPLCPGSLDDRAFEAEQDIYYHATIGAPDWRRTQTGGGNFLQNLSYRARDWAYARLQIGLEDDPRIADFLAGMLIGYRQEIPADIEQDFRRTGTLHVFAVSGQNIAELMVVVIVLLQLCGFVRWRWAWTLAPVVLLYCLLTGSPASAVRATVMVLAVLLAWKLGRPLHALGCWSIALIAMLLWNPIILLDPGAQLSFGVVLGIVLIAPPLMRVLQRPFARDPFLPEKLLTIAQKREEFFWHYAAALLAATLAATLVSEPITAIDFHQVTPVSALANLAVVPAAGLITIVGTMGVAFSLVSTTWAALLNNANWLFARLLIAFVGFLAHEPGASLNVPDVRSFSAPEPSFVVAPVQDSACLLVRAPGAAWLFNAGRDGPARTTTSHLLQFYGINRLDGLVLAQMSAADNGGAEVIVRDFHPRHLVVPVLRTKSPMEKTMPDLLALFGKPAEPWQRGGQLDLSPGVSVEALHPTADGSETHAEDRGLVLLFHAAGQTLLWAGKIGPQLQRDLLAARPGLRADVLVLDPDSAPSAAWLRTLGVRHWLQIPRRDRQLNAPTEQADEEPACTLWPLDRTGAVEIHFVPAAREKPPEILLRPWMALPVP